MLTVVSRALSFLHDCLLFVLNIFSLEKSNILIKQNAAQSAWAVKYTNYISAER